MSAGQLSVKVKGFNNNCVWYELLCIVPSTPGELLYDLKHVIIKICLITEQGLEQQPERTISHQLITHASSSWLAKKSKSNHFFDLSS